ncbi:MAG: DUF6624 domain-containing protein [Candidatus Zixiibacteriota bacterium]
MPINIRILSKCFLLLLSIIVVGEIYAESADELLGKANSAYTAGDYQACVDFYRQAIDNGATSKSMYYNAACCCALNGNTDLAYEYLNTAIEYGFHNIDWLSQDSDLQSLRSDDRWAGLIGACEAANAKYLENINQELYRLYQEDQGDRMGAGGIDWSQVNERDAERRNRTIEILDAGLVKASDDYYHAAMIFQHGRDTTDYWRAHELALKAVELDSSNNIARWLAAAAMDRYLWNVGKPQIYGTQTHLIDGVWTIEPIDTTAVTDAERAEWQVPPLSEAIKKAERMNQQ